MTERGRRLTAAFVAGAAAVTAAVAGWAIGEVGIVLIIAGGAALFAYFAAASDTPSRLEPATPAPTPPVTAVSIEALADPALLIDGGSRITAANDAARR